MSFSQPWLEVNFGATYSGLVGTVGYRLYQNDDSDSISRAIANIVEIGINTGCYGVVPPSIPDNAVGVEWDTGGSSPVSATEDLEPYRRAAGLASKLPTNYIMGSSVQTDKDDEIDSILADTENIQTRLPAALVGGRMDSDVGNMQASVVDAASIATDAVDNNALATTAVAEIATYLETGGPNPHGTGAWDATNSGLSQQQVRDALKLTPSIGVPSSGSVDEHLDDILTDTTAIDSRLPSDPADQSLLMAEHEATQSGLSALQDLSITDIQTAMTNQGYTSLRASYIDLTRKIMTNRLELADGAINNWVLYDDNDVDILLTWSVKDKGGAAISQPASAPSRRTKAT